MAEDPFRPIARSRRRTAATPAAIPSKEEWTVLLPVPKNAPAPPTEHFKRGKPSRVETYRDRQDREIGFIWRFDLLDGGKEFLPLTYCKSREGKLAWRWQAWPAPRPLYGLDRLAKRPKAPVIVCEGEKAADAAAQLLPGHVCLTSPNGSQAAAKADWSPLTNRDVTIWPDADEPGRKYAAEVKRRLAPIAASVKVIDPPKGAKPGWDAADALGEGWDRARAEAFVASSPAPSRRDEAVDDAGSAKDGEPRGRPRQSGELLELALIEGTELWHSPDTTAYVTVAVNGHRENWPVRSKTFRMWLARRFHEATGGAPGSQATEDALRVIEGKALFDGPEHTPWLRLAEHDGDIYLDLADDEWRAVRIRAGTSWEVIREPPIKFIRSRSMLPLPVPEAGGLIEQLYNLINVQAEGDQRLVVAWLVGALRPRGPYTILALSGTQGAAKTSLSRLLRYLIDPHELKDRGPPRDEQTLIVSARNSWVSAFDNLTSVPSWLADALCRLATGGGFSSRELYTDFDEIIIHVTRPVVLTGIEDIATRPDLADRTIHLKLAEIDESRRLTEDEFWAEAKRLRPMILGALLDAVSSALRHRDERPPVLTRMADFVAFVHAAEPGLGWDAGTFLRAYLANRGEAIDTVLDASPLGRAIMRLIFDKNWCGTATALLAGLSVEDRVRSSAEWPAVNKLRGRLARLIPALRTKQIDIAYGETKDAAHEKLIIIRRRGRPDPPAWPAMTEKP